MKTRAASSLELFLLALIDSGLTTPYEFHRQAGISVGASLPALRSLLQQKLIIRGRQGERRRMEYSLTERGSSFLKKSRTENFPELQDLQAALRLAVIAHLTGRRVQALQLLREYRSGMEVRSAPQVETDLESPASMYKWMLSVRERHQGKAELQALSEIIKVLKHRQR